MNKLVSAGILGTGYYIPEKVLTNADLEHMVDTSDEWIRTRTGIEERHIAADTENTSDLSVKAARQALEAAGTKPEEVEFIIVATASPDYVVPSTACMVQNKLGCTGAAGMDISAGCAGFVYASIVGAQMVRSGLYKRVLVIGAEVLSRLVNWKDRNTCVLFGDGAGAAVYGPVKDGFGLLGSDAGADGSLGHILNIPASGIAEPVTHRAIDSGRIYIHMDGADVFKAAVRHMEHSTMRALEQSGLSKEEISLLIPHQANFRIIHSMAKKLGLPEEKVFVNIHKYGNTSAASIPIALGEAVEEGRLKHGDILAITGFGAGLAWASAIMRWQ